MNHRRCHGPVESDSKAHAILNYFRRLGWALEYYPWCEAGRRDLEWYGPQDAANEDDPQVVLDLESENDLTTLRQTITKLAAVPADPAKAARIRMALVWGTADARHALSDEDMARMRACSANQRDELLVTVRSTTEEAQPANIPPLGKAWLYPVRTWLARQGT